MKKEAEAQLIKTLDGQMKQLPGVAKTMVQQYQASAIALTIIFTIMFILSVLTAIIICKKRFKQVQKENSDYVSDVVYEDFLTLILQGCIPAGMLTFCGVIINLIHAMAPIASILNQIIE